MGITRWSVVLAGAAVLSWGVPAPVAAQEAGSEPAADKPAPKKRLYDEQADARKQIAAALAKAKKENRRVLIQWGANWCTWCYALDDTLKKDRDVAQKLLYEYDVVHVNMSNETEAGAKNKEYAATLGAQLRSVPYLTILDADGRPVIHQATEPFEVSQDVKAGHDPEKLLAFLTEHQAPYLSAESILADGLAKANAEGKRVFLHFGAPWCGWCHRLEDWMAREGVAEVFAKHFIDVKIDTERTIGGADLLKDKTERTPTGIPWSAILDERGAVAAPSFMDGRQNIGYPYSDGEIEAFIAMLRTGAPAMSDHELEYLARSLRRARPERP